MVHTNTYNVSTREDSANLTTNSVLYKNGEPITDYVNSTSSGTSINTINGCQNQLVYTTGTSETWQGLTYTYSDNLIVNTTTSVVKNFTTGCDIATSDENYYLTNIKISGCNCCRIQNVTI